MRQRKGGKEGRLYFSTPLMEELHFGTFEPASLEECDESRPLEKKKGERAAGGKEMGGGWAGSRWGYGLIIE